MKRFKEKTVIITGAGSTIGQATAIRFAQEGANVVIVGQSKEVLEATTKSFPQDHTWIHSDHHLNVTCDVSNSKQVTAMLEHVAKKFDSIDVLVTTMGLTATQMMRGLNDEQLLIAMQKYHQNMINICHSAADKLATVKGNIVNIATLPDEIIPSNSATRTAINTEAYKATRQMVSDFASKGVRINNVEPKLNHSALLSNNRPNPSDVAAVVSFLASEDAAMVNGINLLVDGGANAINQPN